MTRPIVLIHGYSDAGASFAVWKRTLEARGHRQVSVASYVSLSNEVTIKDIAEGLDRALGEEAGLDGEQPFDAIVHSTGMLVLRSWLVNYPARRGRLKHLVALAPATFGSPLAHKGRSWLGALFKGSKHAGPDFMEAGDLVLDGLELASSFTWELAHADLLGGETFYGPTRVTPFVFVFCGNRSYRGLRSLVGEPGTDGTVRWAGCALNARKIVIDLTRGVDESDRITVARWSNEDAPLVFAAGHDHGSILREPDPVLVDLVERALGVSGAAEYAAWRTAALARTSALRKSLTSWQQFVVHATDERGDPIRDFNVKLFTAEARARRRALAEFDLDVHTYAADPSYRSFHVNLSKLRPESLAGEGRELWLRVRASTGSRLVGYQGYGDGVEIEQVNLNVSSLLGGAAVTLFHPFTTTLLELKLNREPLPLGGVNDVLWFLPRKRGR
jgi:hypothetical protein